MVILSEFRIEQYRVDGHREDAPHFNDDLMGPPFNILIDFLEAHDLEWFYQIV